MYIKNTDENTIIPPDLKQTFENKFTFNISKNEIIKMKSNNVITDRDLEIAKFLFKFKFATANQIYRLLHEDPNKINIKNRLDKLVKYRVLNKFMLSDIVQESIESDALEIYCLDLGGKYLLTNYSNEDTSDWYSTINMKSSEIIGKNLFTSTFFLRLNETCKDKLVYFKVDPELRVCKKNVIPSFEFCMKIGGVKRYFLAEVVRDYDLPIYFKDKVEKLESLLTTNAWKKYYYDSDSSPILFIFADTDISALESAKIIDETSEITKYRLSTDKRIQTTLYETGAFLKYLPEQKALQQIKAVTFKS